MSESVCVHCVYSDPTTDCPGCILGKYFSYENRDDFVELSGPVGGEEALANILLGIPQGERRGFIDHNLSILRGKKPVVEELDDPCEAQLEAVQTEVDKIEKEFKDLLKRAIDVQKPLYSLRGLAGKHLKTAQEELVAAQKEVSQIEERKLRMEEEDNQLRLFMNKAVISVSIVMDKVNKGGGDGETSKRKR